MNEDNVIGVVAGVGAVFLAIALLTGRDKVRKRIRRARRRSRKS